MRRCARSVVVPLLVVGLFVASGCTGGDGPAPHAGEGATADGLTAATFDGCDPLLAYLRDAAAGRVGAYGPDDWTVALSASVNDPLSSLDASLRWADLADDPSRLPAAVGSGTAHLLDSNGTLVVVAGASDLTVLDEQSGVVLGTVPLPAALEREVLLADRTAIVVSNALGSGSPADRTLRVTAVDVVEPDRPVVAASLRIDHVSVIAVAREGGALQLAISSQAPAAQWVLPGTVGSEAQAAEHNRAILVGLALPDWLPAATVSVDGSTSSVTWIRCDQIRRADASDGPGLVSILTLDPADDLAIVDATGLVGAASWSAAAVQLARPTLIQTDEPDGLDLLDLGRPGAPTLRGPVGVLRDVVGVRRGPRGEVLALTVLDPASGEGIGVHVFAGATADDLAEISTWGSADLTWSPAPGAPAMTVLGDDIVIPAATGDGSFQGAVVLRLGAADVTEAGRITHDPRRQESDCAVVDPASLDDRSELRSLAGNAVLLACGPDDIGGYGSWRCETTGVARLEQWGPPPSQSDLDTWSGAPVDRVQRCTPDRDRFAVAAAWSTPGRIWTATRDLIQANLVADLRPEAVVTID